MKKLIALAILAFSLTACVPRPVDEYVEIGPSETAFLVTLDGNTKEGQGKLNSIEYLEKNKVQAKRVFIPHTIINKCPTKLIGGCYEDAPSARLFKINRAPVTREWTSNTKTGTSATNQAFKVESNESIDFFIGATLTARVDEADTAKFLYYYSGKQLAEIVDSDVRGYIGSIISQQFGSNVVDWGRKNKNVIFNTALEQARKHFADFGITIIQLGYTEGMNYTDEAIQKAINKKFEADMSVEAAQKQLEAAQKLAQAGAAVQMSQELEMKKKLVDGQIEMMKKWDGKLPTTMYGTDPFAALRQMQGSLTK
jgi:hypothetical protein